MISLTLMIVELHFRHPENGRFSIKFGLLYRVSVYILFYKREFCWDKMQCHVRCMERYVILDVWDSLHVDYVVTDVLKGSCVNKSICDTIYRRSYKFVWYQIYGIARAFYIAMCDLRFMDDLLPIDTWYQMDGKACS
jgi:hypothetical protein